MIRSKSGAVAAAALGMCMAVSSPALAQDTSEFLAKVKRSLGAETAPTDGISDAEAVKIALNRGAAIRMARENGIVLTEDQIHAVGLEPIDVAALGVPSAAPAPAPVLVADPAPQPETAREVIADTALPPVFSPRPRARPVTLASVVAGAGPVDDTTSITTSGDTLFWRVTAERVNLRAGPGTQHDVVTQIGSDAQVLALSDTALDWVEIQLPRDGTVAWISAQFLAPADS